MTTTALRQPYPSPAVTAALFALIALAAVTSLALLAMVDDPVRLKALIEDDGPVQRTGLTAIAITFALALFYTLWDRARRSSYLLLSYLLLFYTLREADYHYKVSEYAKATQFKRFYLHDMIPLHTKLLMGALVILFLFTLVYYLRRQLPGFFAALGQRLPWALSALGWAAVFGLSQLIDQVPLFHNEIGQAWEEVFEATAQLLALAAMILFRLQLFGDKNRGVVNPV